MIKVVELPTFAREVDSSVQELLNEATAEIATGRVKGFAFVTFDEDGRNVAKASSTTQRSRMLTGILDLLFQVQGTGQ